MQDDNHCSNLVVLYKMALTVAIIVSIVSLCSCSLYTDGLLQVIYGIHMYHHLTFVRSHNKLLSQVFTTLCQSKSVPLYVIWVGQLECRTKVLVFWAHCQALQV